MKKEQWNELLYQALETEIGGVQVYEKAVECAVNKDLKEEWERYLEETREHERILRGVFETLGLDADAESPGREIVRHKGHALILAMEMAQRAGDPKAAEIVAAECIVDAETKDHLNWQLIGEAITKTTGETKKVLKQAHELVEDQEDEHLYHTAGWTRELWIESLGLPAVLPPPEEEKEVTTAIGAARARQSRKDML